MGRAPQCLALDSLKGREKERKGERREGIKEGREGKEKAEERGEKGNRKEGPSPTGDSLAGKDPVIPARIKKASDFIFAMN